MTKAQLNAFLDTFKLTSTDSASDVGESDVERKMLAHYIKKTGDENFEMLGYKQESVSVASNYEENTVTDVTGTTYNDIIGKAETIELSEYSLNPSNTAFLEDAGKRKIGDQEIEMQDYEILTVYGFYRDGTGKCLATLEKGCSVKLDNLGGQSTVHSDITITLSGKKTFGTVAEIVAAPTFAEHTPSE